MSDHAFALKDDDADDEQLSEDVEADDDGLEETSDVEQERDDGDGDQDDSHDLDDSAVDVVTLEWLPDDSEQTRPIPDAVEMNGELLDDAYDEAHDARKVAGEAKESVEQAQEAALDEDALESLRDRVNELESWKQDAITALSKQGRQIGLLFTASDIADAGMCPVCDDAPLEVQNHALKDSTIECSNDDCDHVAAKLE